MTEPRRQFRLPEADEEYLNSTGYVWETVCEGQMRRLVVRGFSIPTGYNLPVVDLNLRIEGGYPDSQIDMVYFHPPLARTDNKAIGALTTDPFDSLTWQRWSRHRTAENPWRPGEDGVQTQLLLVQHWLEREFLKS